MKNMWSAFVLTLLLTGCASSGVRTSELPPVPITPGAVVTADAICIPKQEAAELILWIEHVERVCQ